MNRQSWFRFADATAATVIRFFAWWLEELASFFPARWRTTEPARLEVHKSADGLDITLARPPRILRKAQLRNGCFEPADFRALVVDRQLPLWLFPPAESILRRQLQIPSSATARFATLLRLEIDRWSPYRIDEVYAAWEACGLANSSQREVDLRLVPRQIVENMRTELAKLNLTASYLVLGISPRLRIDLRSWTDRLLRSGAVSVHLLVATALLALCMDWVAAKHELAVWRERYRIELGQLTRQHSLEDRISRAIATIEKNGGAKSRGKILADISAVIPETDWLTEISIKKDEITVHGYTVNVDRLIKAFEPLALDRNINVQGEVVSETANKRQRFAIAFRPEGA